MVGAFVRLAIGLPRKTDLREQLAHAVGADGVAHPGEGGCQFVEALRHPQQWTDRIAQRRRLDEALQVPKQRRVPFGQRLRAAALTANLSRLQGRCVEVFQPASDGAAREPRDLRDGRKATPPGSPRLACGEQPPSSLVPLRAVRIPSLPNRLCIDHADPGSGPRSPRESGSSESIRRRGAPGNTIHLLLRVSLGFAWK